MNQDPAAKDLADPSTDVLDARVVLLTHYIPIHQLPIYQELSRRIRDFSVLLSTDIEPNRHFRPNWAELEVSVQKTLTLQRLWRHNTGFKDTLYVHFPYDTHSQLRRLQPDVILSYELGFRSMSSLLYRMLYRRGKVVLCTFMSEHSEQGRGLARAALRRWSVRHANAITYNGPSCQRVVTQLGASPDKLFHFPYAANPDCVFDGPIAPTAESKLRLVCIGQLSERKGVTKLIEQMVQYAIANLARSIELTLIGEGPLTSSIAKTATPDNLKIVLPGGLPPESLRSVFPDHDVLVFPTLADEWGLVVNEALHAGMPVIGSRFAQASTSLIEHGRNGLIYNPLTEGELASVLDQFFRLSRDQRTQMARDARLSVRHITPAFAADGAIRACEYVLRSAPQNSN